MKVLYMIGCICLSLLGNVSQAVETKVYYTEDSRRGRAASNVIKRGLVVPI